jgi:hypothetical protein
MVKSTARKNLDAMTKNESKWKFAIRELESMIEETKDKHRRRFLRAAVGWFKRMDELGEPWPGERRKRSKKSDR